MARLSLLIKLLNSTSRFTITTNTVTGPTYFHFVEFTYNNAPNMTTSVSPFFTNKGYNPNLSVHPE